MDLMVCVCVNVCIYVCMYDYHVAVAFKPLASFGTCVHVCDCACGSVYIRVRVLVPLCAHASMLVACDSDHNVLVQMLSTCACAMYSYADFNVHLFVCLQMPVMGGIEATQHIRVLPAIQQP